jgi:hypothetical protein
MQRKLIGLVVFLILPQQVLAQHAASPAARAAFREAVEDYQMFVLPHCAPQEVEAYVAARSGRDRAFIRSIDHTALETDYREAVAQRAAKDKATVYFCDEPPPFRLYRLLTRLHCLPRQHRPSTNGATLWQSTLREVTGSSRL